MHVRIALIAVCLAVAAGCSNPNFPTIPKAPQTTGFPHILRAYDTVAGGVQLTGIAYDQDSNALAGHPHDEWIEISCLSWPYLVLTSGWTIATSSMPQHRVFADTIDHIMYVYSHGSNDSAALAVRYLGLPDSTWLLRNDHDTVRLFDQTGALVSTLGY